MYLTATEHTIQLAPNKDSEEERRRFSQLQQLLYKVTDIPVKDMHRHSLLEEVGVDSLVTIEVLDEMRKAFEVGITISELEEAKDLGSLCSLVEPKYLQQLRRVNVPLEPVIDLYIVEEMQGLDFSNPVDNRKVQGAVVSYNQKINNKGSITVERNP